jgi:hypothetical protein
MMLLGNGNPMQRGLLQQGVGVDGFGEDVARVTADPSPEFLRG